MQSSNSSKQYDAIVIGSGMGGLATASLLAQLGKKRVLVVERHFKLGGFTHSFRRQKYEWDVGLHYVGEMQPGSISRGVMNLVTRHGVDWHPMGSPFERYHFPQAKFEVPSDVKQFEEKLIAAFPEEQKAIRQYFVDLQRAKNWTVRWFVSKVYSRPIAKLLTLSGARLASMTTGEYLSRFQDPLLRAILAAQWPDYGTSPDTSAFGIHATVAVDYFHGGFYPVGGAKEIALKATEAIEAQGGQCLVNHEVVRILVRNGSVYGVVTRNKDQEIEFLAPKVISNAGGVTTFGSLVPEGLAAPEREKLKRLVRGTSASILFLGLKDDPRKHGFDDANYWLYSSLDHDATAREQCGSNAIGGAFVTFGSLRNPGQEPHVAQLICFGDEQPWQPFRDTQWQRRGEHYEAQKSAMAARMLGFAEHYMPGLTELVEFQELSTPLTIKSFTGHSGGAIYGQASDINRLFRDKWNIASSIRGLYLTGSDVGLPGVNGALMAGAMVAAKLLGPFGMPRVMMAATKNSR